MALVRMALVGLAAAMALGGGAGAALADTKNFTARFGNVAVSRVSVVGTVEGNRYAARSVVRDTGVIGLLFDFRYDGAASGALGAGGRPQPSRFEATNDDGKTVRRTVMTYSNGTPVSASQDPPRPERKFNIRPQDQGGTMDPVSAMWWLLQDRPEAQVCNMRVPIYDGFRRTEVRIGAPSVQGGQITCPGALVRVAGFSQNQLNDRRQFDFTLVLNRSGGMASVARLVTDTTFGRVTISRQ